MSYYEENAPKGEYVLVVAGAAPKTGAVVTLEDGVAQVLALKEQGMRLKDAAKEVAEHTGLSKNDLYACRLGAVRGKKSRARSNRAGIALFCEVLVVKNVV